MKNKDVGKLVLIFALVVSFIVWSYDNALNEIVTASCSHGIECSMYSAISTQRSIGIYLIILFGLIGLYLFFSESINMYLKKKKDYKKMNSEEREIYDLIYSHNGSFAQSKILKEINITKVRLTRVLHRMEKHAIIERKRKGKQNIVKLVSQ